MSVFAGPLNREPRKEEMVGMDQKVRLVMAWGRRRWWWWSVAGGLRKADVVIDVAVMFVRVIVRMRFGRVGKRIYRVFVYMEDMEEAVRVLRMDE